MRTTRLAERGITFMAALVLSVLVAGIASGFLILSHSEARMAESWRYKMKATYLAEAGCEEAAAQIRRLQANYVVVPTYPSKVDINSAESDFSFWYDGSGDLQGTGTLRLGGVNISCTVQQVGEPRSAEAGVGLRFLQAYKLVAETRFMGALGRVTRMIDIAEDPLPGFFAFYGPDLEIQPGPAATFSGRIHSNGNLHIGSGATLRFNSTFIHATGDIFRHRKDDGTIQGGTVSVTPIGVGSYVDWPSTIESTAPDWLDQSQNRWNGSVQAHVPTIEAPEVGSIQPGGHFEQNADLVIRDGRAYDRHGTDITNSLPSGTLSSGSLYDAREGKNVPVTAVDIGKLGSSGYYPANGIIYAYHTSNSSSSPKGIMLTNGSKLAGSLTTVSNAPVYIKGDYNTQDKKPSMVMADAVNLLSNAWTGSKVKGKLPTASNTTYNLAVVTGNLETKWGQYNGGLENLVRFHENWDGKNCRIRGSFINLWESQIARGRWVYGGDKYQAPIRDWNYDTDFDRYDSQPPGRLSGWSVARTTYQEDYP